jgi:hypothetical protein
MAVGCEGLRWGILLEMGSFSIARRMWVVSGTLRCVPDGSFGLFSGSETDVMRLRRASL